MIISVVSARVKMSPFLKEMSCKFSSFGPVFSEISMKFLTFCFDANGVIVLNSLYFV